MTDQQNQTRDVAPLKSGPLNDDSVLENRAPQGASDSADVNSNEVPPEETNSTAEIAPGGSQASGMGPEAQGPSTPSGESRDDELQPENRQAPSEHVAGELSESQQKPGETEEAEEEVVAEDLPPLELIEEGERAPELAKDWYILKVQVNREESIRDALLRRVKVAGLEDYFGEIIVPTEDVAEFNKSGKRRIVKRKLYPGYIMINMAINDDTWFLVRETPGIGDFTGSAGKPTPMDPRDIDRILQSSKPAEEGGGQVKTTIPFKPGDRVRVKEGYFQNFEGDVESIDEANGRITVMINIFGRSTPVELEHWQVESV